MAATGLAAAFFGSRRPFEIREYPVPDPEPGAAVLKITLANVCGSDLHYWRGDLDIVKMGRPIPAALGHEGTGVVYRLGAGVTADTLGQPLREGDRVVFQYFYPCMKCPTCLKGHTYACPTRQHDRTRGIEEWPHFRGTFAQYYYLQRNHALFKVPDALSDDVVSGLNCALTQVISGLDRARLAFNETVVIQGAGGLGVYAAGVAKARGAAKVIAIDGVDERLDLIKAFGADELIDLREWDTPEARVQRVRELTGGLGADVTLELVGHPGVVREGLQMTAPGGRYLEIGNINVGRDTQFDPSWIIFRSITVLGIAHYTACDLRNALDFVRDYRDRLPFDRVASHKFALRDINTAFEQQDKGHVTRSSLVP
ncbi:MAG: zinc-binding dehydrogenase [Actinobacteria bacterium]|nr:zinc-binding dehydrogenase [Actinomycetota bacterium]